MDDNDFDGSDANKITTGRTTSLPTNIFSVSIRQHEGPLPSPSELADYERAYPGAAEWLFAEAKAHATHLRQMERLAYRTQARDAALHRILPFTMVAFFLSGAVALGTYGNPWLGGSAFAAVLGTVVGAYVKGTTKKQTDVR